MNPDDLEHLVEERLRRLPALRAPRTLLPRVMAAVQLAAHPWYTRSWFTWPRVWQVASTLALLVVVAGISIAGAAADQQAPGWLVGLVGVDVIEPAGVVASRVAVALRAFTIVSRTMTESLFGVIPMLFLIMSAATVVLGTVIGRVAMGRVYQS
jgi:hypothetical protein